MVDAKGLKSPGRWRWWSRMYPLLSSWCRSIAQWLWKYNSRYSIAAVGAYVRRGICSKGASSTEGTIIPRQYMELPRLDFRYLTQVHSKNYGTYHFC